MVIFRFIHQVSADGRQCIKQSSQLATCQRSVNRAVSATAAVTRRHQNLVELANFSHSSQVKWGHVLNICLEKLRDCLNRISYKPFLSTKQESRTIKGYLYITQVFCLYSLWCCWLCGRKGIRPVKNWMVRYWCGNLSGTRCNWFAYGPADAITVIPSSLAPVKSRMVYLSGAGLPRLSWKKGR